MLDVCCTNLTILELTNVFIVANKTLANSSILSSSVTTSIAA